MTDDGFSRSNHKVEEKRFNPYAMIIIVAISVILYGFGEYKCNVINRPITDTNGKVIMPGPHILDKFPFMVWFPNDKVNVIHETRWGYIINEYDLIIIPPDHIAIVTDMMPGDPKGEKPYPMENIHEILKPGKYRINLFRYNVRLIDMRPQNIYFGKSGERT